MYDRFRTAFFSLLIAGSTAAALMALTVISVSHTHAEASKITVRSGALHAS